MKDIEFYENTIGKRITEACKDNRRPKCVIVYVNGDDYPHSSKPDTIKIEDCMLIIEKPPICIEYPLWNIKRIDYEYSKN